MINYQKALQKAKEAAERKEKRLLKRLELAKGKGKKVGVNALKRELRRITHRIVRFKFSGCYTCGKMLEFKDRQAGHYWTDGGHSAVRYDFDNLRVQCVSCNMHKSGNLAEYGRRLTAGLGYDAFAALGTRAHQVKKWERWELERLIEERKKMLSNLEV